MPKSVQIRSLALLWQISITWKCSTTFSIVCFQERKRNWLFNLLFIPRRRDLHKAIIAYLFPQLKDPTVFFKEKKEGGLTGDMRPIRKLFFWVQSRPAKDHHEIIRNECRNRPWLAKKRWLFLQAQKQTQNVNWFDDSSVGKSNVFSVKSNSKWVCTDMVTRPSKEILRNSNLYCKFTLTESLRLGDYVWNDTSSLGRSVLLLLLLLLFCRKDRNKSLN